MAVTNSSLIEEVQLELLEWLDGASAAVGVRWTVREIVRHLNSGLRKIVEVRPDAGVTLVANQPLAAGSQQTLPAGARLLFELPGLRLVDRKMQDSALPGWRDATAAAPTSYCYDERDPLRYEVYPPAPLTPGTVRMRYAAFPTAVTLPSAAAVPGDVAGNVPLPDAFINALRNWILFRVKSKDAEFAPGVQAAANTHLTLMASDLGVELKALLASAPRSVDAAAPRPPQAGA